MFALESVLSSDPGLSGFSGLFGLSSLSGFSLFLRLRPGGVLPPLLTIFPFSSTFCPGGTSPLPLPHSKPSGFLELPLSELSVSVSVLLLSSVPADIAGASASGTSGVGSVLSVLSSVTMPSCSSSIVAMLSGRDTLWLLFRRSSILGSWICGRAVVGISTLYPSRMLLSAVVSVEFFLLFPFPLPLLPLLPFPEVPLSPWLYCISVSIFLDHRM